MIGRKPLLANDIGEPGDGAMWAGSRHFKSSTARKPRLPGKPRF